MRDHISAAASYVLAAFQLEDTAAKVKSGELTADKAAERLFRPGRCGIFNPKRAAELLKAMAGRQN